jgi:hypothetical protein
MRFAPPHWALFGHSRRSIKLGSFTRSPPMRHPLWPNSPEKAVRVHPLGQIILAVRIADVVPVVLLAVRVGRVDRVGRATLALLVRSTDRQCGRIFRSAMCLGQDSEWAN